MDLAPDRLHRTTVDIIAELQTDQGLTTEMARAERQFFGGAPDYVPDGPPREVARGRFAEWFVLERESEHLGATPVDAVGGLQDGVRDALKASLCGLFVVESVAPEIRARDAITGEAFELATDAPLAAGDVVVGRVYPAELDAVSPSPVAAILRQGQEVVAALQRDLQRTGIDRRLSQAEIEAVMFRATGELSATQSRRVPPERIEARLDSLLREGGDKDYSAAEISAALEAATDGPGGVIGPLLEALAFETDVDIEASRTTMLELWNEHRLRTQERALVPPPALGSHPSPLLSPLPSPQGAPPTAPEPTLQPGALGATIAARIERGLAAHEDLEALFADVEGMLGDDDEASDDDDDPLGPSAEGDLDALVAEFLWERGHAEDSAPAQVLRGFAEHQRQLPTPGVYLEAIPARELISDLLRVFLATPGAERVAAVRARFAVLREFYAWAVETQAYDLDEPIGQCESMLIEPLPRLQRASAALSVSAVGPAQRPRVLRVARVDGGEIEVVGDGTEPTWIDVPEAAVDLRADDLILSAVVADGRGGLRFQGLAVVLPAAAADLLE